MKTHPAAVTQALQLLVSQRHRISRKLAAGQLPEVVRAPEGEHVDIANAVIKAIHKNRRDPGIQLVTLMRAVESVSNRLNELMKNDDTSPLLPNSGLIDSGADTPDGEVQSEETEVPSVSADGDCD